jgi:hypothetical protein
MILAKVIKGLVGVDEVMRGTMMKEIDILRMLEARADNYALTDISHIRGRAYALTIAGSQYNAVVLFTSFEYYELRYHLAKVKPTFVICYQHNTVLPIPVLSLKAGRLGLAYDLPDDIRDVEAQRFSKTGCRVLLGMYISGVKYAQELVKKLSPTTKSRYLQRAKDLSCRKRGRPVDTQKQSTKK